MIIFDGRSYELFHITRPKIYIVDKYHFSKYKFQSLYLRNNRSCVGNFRFFYLYENVELELLHIQKEIFPVEKVRNYYFSFDALK